MKTLEDIKKEVIDELGLGYISFDEFLLYYGDIESILDKICRRYGNHISQQALKDASENAMIEVNNDVVDIYHIHTDHINATIQANKDSILNTKIKTP